MTNSADKKKRGSERVSLADVALAAGGLMFATSKQLRVPEDIGIAGWGDLPVGAIFAKTPDDDPCSAFAPWSNGR